MKLPYEDQLALKDLLEKAKSTSPTKSKVNNYDSLDTLEDIGYEEPTEDQLNAPGRKAAAKYIAANGVGTDDPTKFAKNMVGRGPAAAMGAYEQESAPFAEGDAPRVLTEQDLATEEPELTLDGPEDVVIEKATNAFKPEFNTPIESQQSQPKDLNSILEQYKELTRQRNAKNTILDLGDAGSLIADAFTQNGGAKGLSQQVMGMNKGLRDRNEQPITDLLGQSKAADTGNELQMNDPNSDISKFARERAISMATKMGVSPESIKSLDKMSAKQLEKLGLYKNDPLAQGSKLGLYYTSIRDDKTGQDRVVGIDRQTGQIVNDIGGKTYSDKIIENKQTGQNEVYKQGAGVSTLDKTTTQTSDEAAKKQAETKTEYSSPTTLNKVNPNLYKEFKKTQDEFTKDMKENREAVTAVTNLNQKLAPGKVKIDSGMLGGIQTQAAKLAGQKGVLTDQDLVKFAGAGGVPAGMSRFFSGNFEGEMTAEDIKFFREFSKNMAKAVADDITNRSKVYSGQILNEAKDYLPGLSEQDVSKWLQVDQVAPAVQQKASAGKVTIQDSTGKSHVIDADKLEAAKKRDPGLKVVGQ